MTIPKYDTGDKNNTTANNIPIVPILKKIVIILNDKQTNVTNNNKQNVVRADSSHDIITT